MVKLTKNTNRRRLNFTPEITTTNCSTSPGPKVKVHIGFHGSSRKSTLKGHCKLACRALVLKQHKTALNHLLQIDELKNSLHQAIKKKISQEVQLVCKMKDCVLRTNNIAKFSWKTAYKQLEANCPLTMEFLNSVAGPSKQKQLPRVMSSMGILLFNRNLKMGTLQAINSIMMFRGHIRTKVYSTFNRDGLCSSYQTTVRHLDKICEGFDLPVRKWSESLSSKHSNMDRVDVTDEHNYALPQISKVPVDESADIKIEEEIPVALIPLDHNMSVSSDSSQYLYTAEPLEDEDPACNSFNSPVQHLQQMTSVESPYTTVNTKMNNDAPTYQIIMDNLNMNTKARHKTEDTSNKIFNLTHSVAVKDRVSSEDLDSCHPQADILSIPNEAFIPKEEDYVALYSDYKVLVQRVLVEFVPAFSDYRDLVIGHILHQYSHESSKKSNVVPLGILEKDENKTEEMIQIIEHLQKYVPRDAKGHMIPIPLGGDALSVERGEAAQKARSDGVTEDDRLEGFIWKSEDWHGHVISLQEAYNRHFKGSSSGERGTLFQLRNRFDHRGVKSTVKDAVNECREFLRFVTKGYIVLAALEILNVNQIDHIQINDNKTNEEKKEFIDQLAGEYYNTEVCSCVKFSARSTRAKPR